MKRIIGVMLILLSCAAFCACTGLSDDYHGWSNSYYGWYEITDAAGEYEDLKGIREDSAAIRKTEGLALYDTDHASSPFLELNVNFNGNKAEVTEGRLGEIRFDKVELKILSDREIRIPYGMWVEGTLETDGGSLTLRGLFCDSATVPGWNQLLEGDSGNLKLSKEELLPEHYETFREYTGSTIRPEEFFSCLKESLATEKVTVTKADEVPLEKQASFIRLDNEADFTQLVLENTWEAGVNSWSIAARSADGSEKRLTGGDGNCGTQVIQLTFGEDMPEYVLYYKDVFRRTYGFVFRMDPVTGTVSLDAEPIE